jgi:hypothetical protein
MKAGEQYRKMLYGGSDSTPVTSLYSTVESPFKKQADPLPGDIMDMDRQLTSDVTPQEKLTNPLQKLIQDNKDAETSDNMLLFPPNTVQAQKINAPDLPFPVTQPVNHTVFNADLFKGQVAAHESSGDTTALNKNSSAVGKYQFLWSKWGNDIKRVTGVDNESQFRGNPKAQDRFMNFYTDKVISPAVQRLQPLADQYKLTPNELAKVIHFRGVDGAERALRNNQLNTKLEPYNPTINQYLGRAK